jgi:hypothetical protein
MKRSWIVSATLSLVEWANAQSDGDAYLDNRGYFGYYENYQIQMRSSVPEINSTPSTDASKQASVI